MVGLTDTQEEILDLLRQAIQDNNSQEVKNIFDNKEYNDIQAVLSHEGTLTSDKGTILNDVIDCSNASVSTKVELIKLIWQKADQKTCDFLCDYKVVNSFEDQPYFTGMIDDLKRFQQKIDHNNTEYSALAQVIQEMKEHERVMGLDSDLQEAIEDLDANRVKAVLENCGADAARVLERCVYWNDGSVDALLVYPLIVDYEGSLDKEEFEKKKEITKLLWDKASPDVRNFWLEDHMVNSKGQNTGDNYIIWYLEKQQKKHAGIAGERWLKDFIQEVKDYKTNREIELNEPVLKGIEERECIAQSDRELAESLQKKLAQDNKKKDTIVNNAATTPANSSETSPAPTAGNTTPAKNDTTFWSEHKGKISLGVVGLCAVGAVAAYVLAYPAVALALTVLAAVILMGAGIAKVLEDPSVERTFTEVQR